MGGTQLDKKWSDVRVKRSMESMCSSFDFVCTQEQPFNYKEWPIKMGASCQVLVDGESVLKGWIEDINVSYDKDSHTVQVSGRDATCDLVDCHKANRHYTYTGSTVKRVVEDTCKPFGIKVKIDPQAVAEANTVPDLAKVFYAAGGDSLIGIIYRITRLVKLYVMAGTDGSLILTVAGVRSAGTGLVLGSNVLRGSLKQSDKERYSVYYVKGFGFENEGLIKSDQWLWMNGTYPPSPPASFPDERTGATRYRPYSNMMESGGNLKNIGWRSKAEAQFRIGNSRKYEYVVQGWREKDGGSLWAPNTLVNVTDSLFGLDKQELLVEGVDYTQTDQGTLTSLSLCYKDKYTAQAQINRIKTIFEEQRGKT